MEVYIDPSTDLRLQLSNAMGTNILIAEGFFPPPIFLSMQYKIKWMQTHKLHTYKVLLVFSLYSL